MHVKYLCFQKSHFIIPNTISKVKDNNVIILLILTFLTKRTDLFLIQRL